MKLHTLSLIRFRKHFCGFVVELIGFNVLHVYSSQVHELCSRHNDVEIHSIFIDRIASHRIYHFA